MVRQLWPVCQRAFRRSGVFKSKGEAKRLVQNGGLYIYSTRVDAEDTKLTQQCLTTERIAVVRTGKKNYHLLKFV